MQCVYVKLTEKRGCLCVVCFIKYSKHPLTECLFCPFRPPTKTEDITKIYPAKQGEATRNEILSSQYKDFADTLHCCQKLLEMKFV
jgi:histone acetyltransferase (RNA polymerase elongator complex component)